MSERKVRKEQHKAAKAKLLSEKKQQQPQGVTLTKKATHRADPKSQPVEVQLSRALSYILRHGAVKQGLEIRQDGYILLDSLLSHSRVRSINLSPDGSARKAALQDIQAIVESNEKKRFEIMQEGEIWYIRAVQGHSIKEVMDTGYTKLTLDNLDLLKGGANEEDELERELANTRLEEEVLIIHGTNAKAWEMIRESGGLKAMTRNHIHLAKGKMGEDGVISGMRKSSSRLLMVDIKWALRDGIPFLLSSNGVVLTPGMQGMLPLKYIVRVDDQVGKMVWQP